MTAPTPRDDADPRGDERSRSPALAWLWAGAGAGFAVFVVLGLRHGWPLAMARAGEKPDVEAYARWGTFWASAVNLAICLAGSVVALAQRRRPGREATDGAGVARTKIGPRESAAQTSRPGESTSRRAWIWLVLILVAAGALRWPRMGLSFYNDEAHTFRNYIAGRFVPAGEGKLKWRQARWIETFWLNKVGNNLMPCSVFGRVSYDAWRKLAGAPNGTVCEAAVRLPQFLAGMASIVVLWLAARRMLGAGAGCWAAALAALHPWHVRYSTEARAYGFLLLGIALCWYFLQRALEDGRRRWWIGLGLAQFLCVWSFAGSVYFLAVLDAMVFVSLARSCARRPSSLDPMLRFAGGLLIGAMVALPLMLPTIPPLVEAMRRLDSLKGEMGLPWWTDALAGIFFGVRGIDWDWENPHNLSLLRAVGRWPGLWVVVAGAVGLWLAGLIIQVRRGGAGRWLALAGPAAVVLSWAIMSARGQFLHPWYVLFTVPSLVLAAAAAVAGVARTPQTLRWLARFASLAVMALWVAADLVYARHGKEDLRGLADAARDARGAPTQGVFAAMVSDVDVYEPTVVSLRVAADLDPLVTQAKARGATLVVSVGHVGIGESPQVFQRLRGSGEFERLAELRGLEEPQFTHFLFRLRGAP